jgi:hypothetical protein
LNNQPLEDSAFHRGERLELAQGRSCEFNEMIALFPSVLVAARKVQLRCALELAVRDANRPEAERRKARLSILDSLPPVHTQVQNKWLTTLYHEGLASW